MMNRIVIPTLTLPRLVVALTFLAIFAMATRVSADTDTWWHLRTGQWIIEHGAVLQTDPFSWTRAGEPWRIPGWIVQAPLYMLFTNFGYTGLNLFTAACVTLTFALIHPTCSGHPLLRAFVLVLAATVSGIYWSARPQIVSLVLAAAFVLILYRWRERQSQGGQPQGLPLRWLPVLMALWANAHGGFAIGFILIGLTFAGEGLKVVGQLFERQRNPNASISNSPIANYRPLLHLILVAIVCALAVVLNPAGPEMLLYPFKTVSIGALREFIQEWQSPNFHELSQQPFLWLLLLTFAVVALSRKPVDVTDLILVCGTAYLGFLAGRNMPLLALTAPALLTRHAAYLLDDVRKRDSVSGASHPARRFIVVNWILLIVFALLALIKVISVLPARVNKSAIAQTVPVGAADFIRREEPPGPLFNSYNFGAYLMWALPEYPVYVDGRTDLYDDAFLREYLSVAFGRPGWDATLRERGARLVLIEADSLLGDRLSESAAWRELYRDEVAAVYERVAP